MVKRMAVVQSGTVINVILADEGFALPDAVLVPVQDAERVSAGWLFDGADFTEPDAPESQPEPLALIADELDQVAARFEAASAAVKGQDTPAQAQALEDAAGGVARAAAIARAAAQQ